MKVSAPAVSSASPPPPPALTDAPNSPAPPPSTPSNSVASWPEWFQSVDVSLLVVAVVSAFLLSATAARNSDLWLTLASGRHLASGNLPLGSDPFSYSATDRPWLQTSWLFDLIAYGLYKVEGTGAALIAFKSLLFATALTLTLLFRRPGTALWPWAMIILGSAVAVGPFVTLRSTAVSPLFLCIVLVLMFCRDWRTPGWQLPLILAGVVALWANLDAWAILGPLCVALLLLGQWLDQILGITSEEDPWPVEPPRTQLLKALLLCGVALLANPSFWAGLTRDPASTVAQLIPAELKFGIPSFSSLEPNSEYQFLHRSPLSAEHFASRNRGQNWNGLALILLLLTGIVCLVMNYRRIRATHILLFVGFTALALNHTRSLIFLPIVGIPIAASFWNMISSKITLGSLAESNTRIILSASMMKRILGLAVAFLVAGSIYPGWVQPGTSDPATQGRLEFRIVADEGLIRVAERLEAIQRETPLPANVQGLNSSAMLGDYLAWFAPSYKAFLNSRFRFHTAELNTILTLRITLLNWKPTPGQDPNFTKIDEVLTEAKAGYLVISTPFGISNALDLPTREMLMTPQQWHLWHLDGRSVVVAKATDQLAQLNAKDLFARHAIRQAFSTREQRLVKAPADFPAPTDLPFWETYFLRPAPSPIDADDAMAWKDYLELLSNQKRNQAIQQAQDIALSNRFAGRALVGVAGAFPFQFLAPPATPADDLDFALPLLMTRLSRQAIAAAPDRPNGYWTLSQSYRLPLAPTAELIMGLLDANERSMQLISARRRLLDRILGPGMARESFSVVIGFQETIELMQLYLQTGQIDFASQAYQTAAQYANNLRPEQFMFLLLQAAGQPLDIPNDQKQFEERYKQMKKQFDTQRDNLRQKVQTDSDNIRRLPNKTDRFFQLIQSGLTSEAISMHDQMTSEDFRENALPVAITKQVALLKSGQLERVAFELPILEEALTKRIAEAKQRQNLMDVQMSEEGMNQLKVLKSMLERLLGNPATAIELQDQLPLPFQDFPKSLSLAGGELSSVCSGLTALGGPVTACVELNSSQFPWPQAYAEKRPRVPGRYILWLGPAPAIEPLVSSRTLPNPNPQQIASVLIAGGIAALSAYVNDFPNPNAKFSNFIADLLRVRQALSIEAQFQYDRAMMALLDGNIPEAERRLKVAQKPQGIDLNKLGDSRAYLIERYLGLIQRANVPASK